MPADMASAQTSSPTERTPIAGLWRRLAAFLIDIVILGVPTMLAGFAFVEWAASLGQAGRLVGFTAALIYFGLLDSRLGSGQTFGKRLLAIRVTDRAGDTLSAPRAGLRFTIVASPYFLNGLWFDLEGVSPGAKELLLGTLLGFVVIGGFGAVVYLFLFNRRTRQSLHDLLVGSFVVRGLPAAVPTRLATPRLHLIVVGCWLVLALAAPGTIAAWIAHDTRLAASLAPLVELQKAMRAQFDVHQVKVKAGSTKTITARTGTSTVTFLQIEAQAAGGEDDLAALQAAIARMVLDRHPDLLGRQVLAIRVGHGFDLGLARWNTNIQSAYDAATWQVILARPPGPRRSSL